MPDEPARCKVVYRRLIAGELLVWMPADVRVTIPSPYSMQEQFGEGGQATRRRPQQRSRDMGTCGVELLHHRDSSKSGFVAPNSQVTASTPLAA